MNTNVVFQQNETPPVRREMIFKDGAISYLEWKLREGLPALHFAHANGFNAMTYRHLLAPLAQHFHIRAWDTRGHGFTTLPADPAKHANGYLYRDDLISFIEPFAAETGGPILLAGHSMGGSISLLTAADRPDLVRGIFLADPVMAPTFRRRLRLSFGRLLGRKSDPLLMSEIAGRRRAVYADRATMADSYKGRGAFRTWPEEMIADYVEGGTVDLADGQVGLACAPAMEAANFHMQSLRIQSQSIWEALHKLEVPLSLIYAGQHSTCLEPTPRIFGERDPQAVLLRLGQATHFLTMEFPDITRREILALHARLG